MSTAKQLLEQALAKLDEAIVLQQQAFAAYSAANSEEETSRELIQEGIEDAINEIAYQIDCSACNTVVV